MPYFELAESLEKLLQDKVFKTEKYIENLKLIEILKSKNLDCVFTEKTYTKTGNKEYIIEIIN